MLHLNPIGWCETIPVTFTLPWSPGCLQMSRCPPPHRKAIWIPLRMTYDASGESERGMKFDLAISSTAVSQIELRWRFRWFCRTHLALQTPRNTNVIGKVFNSMYALVGMAMRRVYCHFWGTFLGSFWWSAWRGARWNCDSSEEINTGTRYDKGLRFLGSEVWGF